MALIHGVSGASRREEFGSKIHIPDTKTNSHVGWKSSTVAECYIEYSVSKKSHVANKIFAQKKITGEAVGQASSQKNNRIN